MTHWSWVDPVVASLAWRTNAHRLETCQDPGVDAAVWISVVAASVTVVSLPFSVRAANSARLSVREARRQTELQERVHRDSAQPYVWADLQGDDAQGQLLRLIVTNEGPSIATAVPTLSWATSLEKLPTPRTVKRM